MHYSPLKKRDDADSIRLLRLLPNEDKNAMIECQLVDYFLPKVDTDNHLYEALSYVWGDPHHTHSITLDNGSFGVTANLYAALARLRNRYIERLIWIDAICINQEELKERESQIQFMAKIYGKARCVIVWLGEAAAGSDQAIEGINHAADNNHTASITTELQIQVLRLIERPWFQRVWVLQEVAAARQIIITCGASQIDGYAFCEGLKNLKIPYEESVGSHIWIRSVAFLIRQAIFRTKSPIWWSGRTSLEISPLPELIDMYRSHKATIHHDKIFSLLGMNSDDLTGTGLSPNYNLPWVEVFDHLLRYVFGNNLQTEILGDGDLAVVRTKCQIIGKIVLVKRDISWSDKQEVEASLWKEATKSKEKAQLTFSASAEPISGGDLICFLQNTPRPMIVRAFRDYFRLIKTAAIWDEINLRPNWTNSPEDVPRKIKQDHLIQAIKTMNTSPRDLLLVWDWNIHDHIFSNQEYGDLETRWYGIQTGSELKAERLSNAALILAEWEESVKVQKRIRDALSFCYDTVGKDHLSTLRCLDALGLAQKCNQQFEEAEYTLIEVIQARTRIQGLTHSDTLSSMNTFEHLALVCKWNGTLKEREAEKRITVILSVLKRKDNDSLTEEDIKYFASFVDAKTMLFIIENRGHEFKITEDVLKAVIRRSDQEAKEIINLLFDKRREEIKTTEEAFKFAAETSCTDIVRRFLEERPEECKVTEEVVKVATRNPQKAVLKLLLRHAGDQFKLTESFFKVLTGCVNESVIEVLLKERGNEIKITEEMVEAAIKNPVGDGVVLFFLRNRGNEFSITEELLVALAESPRASSIWWAFIQDRGYDLQITARVLESAARYKSGYQMIFYLFETLSKNGKRSTTEEIVKMAAGNINCGHHLVSTFLREKRDEFQVTERVIRAAYVSGLSVNGAQIMSLLLDRLGDSPRIPDKILQAIPKEWRSQEKINDWIRTRRH